MVVQDYNPSRRQGRAELPEFQLGLHRQNLKKEKVEVKLLL